MAGKRPPARSRILDTATELFNAHGVRGVGVDRIIAESGVAKATLYAHFRSKDDLVVAYLHGADGHWRGALQEAAADAGADPREQLLGLFDALRTATVCDGFRGCAFINTASETEPGTVPHATTVEHKQAVRAWLGELTSAAGAVDPDLLARQLSVLIDGVMSAAALEPTAEFTEAARAAAHTLVSAACRGSDAPKSVTRDSAPA
ncbi:TetR/AcrR family transcriptional regulator [Streptomyces zagrosensis]|uniref:AcrR family transcriptional regulator n=1 Tax=Streptomyces zagrosensis TaxID=1042984 RepID=A0A7W9QB38_9ACTN|nr:TetR/AcrR family transcriptional regulator [Streptomyces zagrosensis]MBB5936940.1 AcrR family transcriptional regulator [Streptomyces zagrosensis]